jgi:Na+/melibiose symporter-like transporter
MMDWTCCRWRCPLSLVAAPDPGHNSMWFLLVGVLEGHGLCTPIVPVLSGFPEKNQSCCGDYQTWTVAVGVAEIRLSHWCVPSNERCAHRSTLMDRHKIWTVKLDWHMLCLYTIRNMKYARIWNPSTLLVTLCTFLTVKISKNVFMYWNAHVLGRKYMCI